jgi:hypothetical protein
MGLGLTNRSLRDTTQCRASLSKFIEPRRLGFELVDLTKDLATSKCSQVVPASIGLHIQKNKTISRVLHVNSPDLEKDDRPILLNLLTSDRFASQI